MTNRSRHIVHRRHSLILTTVAAVAAVLVAGCGRGSGPGVANLGGSTSTSPSSSGGNPTQTQIQQAQRDVVRFAGCMHSHGVPSLPDPTVSPRAFKDALNSKSRAFESAYTVCGHLLPPGRPSSQHTARSPRQVDALLAFARCLRSHGYPSFPDPTSSGEVTRQMLARAGIDLHEPAVVQAADACTSVTHGVITRAIVARFVAGH
jgi:hypothetical protein